MSVRVTPSLCSADIAPLHRYYGGVRPWSAYRYFRPRGFGHLCLFPWRRRPGSQVPFESPDWSHASSTPDTAWTVSRYLPCIYPGGGSLPRFRRPSENVSMHRVGGSLALVSPVHA